MSQSDSDRILAEGAPVTLNDGGVRHVRYKMREVRVLERRYGSLPAVQQVLDDINKGVRVFDPTMELLAIGLAHEGITEDELDDLTEPDRIADYVKAVGEALDQAFPQGADPEGNPNGEAKKTKVSPGPTGTTSPLPSSAEATTSSGE